MLRRLCLLGALLVVGCRGVVGPLQHRPPERVDDPRLPIAEQERRGRDRLALPQWSGRVLPTDPGLLPGPNGM